MSSGLDDISYAGCDQLRVVSVERLSSRQGIISPEQMQAIDQALRFVLDLQCPALGVDRRRRRMKTIGVQGNRTHITGNPPYSIPPYSSRVQSEVAVGEDPFDDDLKLRLPD
ncbi:MAG: type II toxin-antitoxin system PemK/MazF family toxin [Mycobacterium sp.]